MMLAKLCALNPAAVLAGADLLIEPLTKTLTVRMKQDAVQQEKDRQAETLRSCLRGVSAVFAMPGVDACAPFQAFRQKVVMVAPVKDFYLQIQKEINDANVMDTRP